MEVLKELWSKKQRLPLPAEMEIDIVSLSMDSEDGMGVEVMME